MSCELNSSPAVPGVHPDDEWGRAESTNSAWVFKCLGLFVFRVLYRQGGDLAL